jgi:hypothetical protein
MITLVVALATTVISCLTARANLKAAKMSLSSKLNPFPELAFFKKT